MEEYLFKGRTYNHEWVEGTLVRYSNNYAFILPKQMQLSINNGDEVEVIPQTVCQCTGLVDTSKKNKIFKGDIIKFKFPYSKEFNIGVVVYNTKEACFELHQKENGNSHYTKFKDLTALQKIGNIYDNFKLNK